MTSIDDSSFDRFEGKAPAGGPASAHPTLPADKQMIILADGAIERYVARRQEPAPYKVRDELALRINALEYKVRCSPERVEQSLNLWADLARQQQNSEPDGEAWSDAPKFNKETGQVDGGYAKMSTTVHTESPDTLENAGHANARGIRSNNEDSYMAETMTFTIGSTDYTAQITGVFDGHGDNGDCATHAARYLPEALQSRLEEFNPEGLSDVGIFNALKLAMVDVSRRYQGMGGSTGNVVVRIGDDLWIANTGDSRALVIDPVGEVLQLSEDAKLGRVIKKTDDNGEIKLEREETGYVETVLHRGGFVKPSPRDPNGHLRIRGVLAPARALGDHALKGAVSSRPKITKLTLPNGGLEYTLVQCCDGIFDVASSNQVGRMVHGLRKSEDCASIAANIVAAAFQAGSPDNMTALVTNLGAPMDLTSPVELREHP